MGVRLLGKMKLYELAKEMDVSSKELLEKAKELGINIKSHLSAISDDDIKNLKDKYSRENSAGKKEEKAPKTENAQNKSKKESISKKENAQKKDNPVIIRREVIIEEDERKNKVQEENKAKENKNPFVQRNQKKDFNIVYRNIPTKPMTVSELFGLYKEENKEGNK